MPILHPAFFHLLSPELALVCFGTLFLILSAVPGGKDLKRGIGALTLLGLAMALVLTLQTVHALGGASVNALVTQSGSISLTIDPFSQWFKVIFLVATLLAVLMSFKHLDIENAFTGEYFTLLTFAVVGMMIMASGRDLLTLWVGLETMALCVYVLAAYLRHSEKSIEGAVKYFLLGAVSSGFYLYGASFIYGATGSVHLSSIRKYIGTVVAAEGPGAIGFPLAAGILILAVALLFKAALVPFHWWTPDAYEGAPTPITAFMSVAPKAAAFAMALRIFIEALLPLGQYWSGLLALVAIITMIWGNIAAMLQDNVKRMLAYSSIAHAGYALIGLAASGVTRTDRGVTATVFYLLVYAFMNLGAFGLVLYLQREGSAGDRLDDFNGLYRRSPAMAVIMTIFLLSLTGIPPLAGFVGKLQLFSAAVDAELWTLAVIGILTSVVSLYYYFRIVYRMMLHQDVESEGAVEKPRMGFTLGVAMAVNLAGTVLIGIVPNSVLVWISQAGLLGR